MKITKLSLIAALAVTTAMAGEGKISGDAKLFYSTSDADGGSLFDKGLNSSGNAVSIGDTALELKYSRDLTEGITVNAGITGVSTLGLEGNLVSGTWVNHPGVPPVDDAMYLDTANIVAKVANTTLVVGRQALDTPFFYSETWNIVPNTFDAAVAVNNDIPNTTLVGAWVGRGNGDVGGQTVNAANNGAGFAKFAGDTQSAYAAGIVNKSVPNTALQAWYYAITSTAKAYWLQGDTTLANNITLGAQYADAKLNGASSSTNAYAVKAGYSEGPLSAHIAYSKRNNKAGINIANIPTSAGVGSPNNPSESRLYTEAFWNYGFVGQQDAKTVSVGGSYDLGSAKLGASYTDSKTSLATRNMKEFALTASTKVGPVDTTVAFINTSGNALDGSGNPIKGNTVQAYLTVPFGL